MHLVTVSVVWYGGALVSWVVQSCLTDDTRSEQRKNPGGAEQQGAPSHLASAVFRLSIRCFASYVSPPLFAECDGPMAAAPIGASGYTAHVVTTRYARLRRLSSLGRSGDNHYRPTSYLVLSIAWIQHYRSTVTLTVITSLSRIILHVFGPPCC